MDDKDFFSRLAALVETTRKEHGLDSDHDALLLWYLQYKYDLDPIDLVDRIVHDKHAEGVDAVVLEPQKRVFYFAQAKFVSSYEGTAKNLSETDVKASLAGVGYLLKGDYKGHVTPALENLVDEYHDYEKSGDYQTAVLFICAKKPPVSDKFIRKFESEHGHSVEMVCFAALKKFYEDEYLVFRSPPPTKISFVLAGSPHRKNEPFPSAVFSIKARELAKTYDEHRERLFQQNVRDPMGLKGAINKLIHRTATDPGSGDKFWYFNNGINLVCKRMHFASSGKVVTIEEPQVINGAQTTHAVHQAYTDGKLGDNVELLVKATEVSEREFVEQVTRYSNAQNAIRLRDLASNDEIQDRLYRALLDSHGAFYQRKRGEFDMKFPTAAAKVKRFGKRYTDRIIDNEKAGLSYLSTYLGRPVDAKKERWKVFYRDGGYYQEIFDDRVSALAERFLLVWTLSGFVQNRKKAYRKLYNSEKDKSRPSRAVLDDYFITQADFFIENVMFGLLGRKRDLSVTAKILDATRLLTEAQPEATEIYDASVNAVRRVYLEDRARPGSYVNNFFKSPKNLAAIRDGLSLVEVAERP